MAVSDFSAIRTRATARSTWCAGAWTLNRRVECWRFASDIYFFGLLLLCIMKYTPAALIGFQFQFCGPENIASHKLPFSISRDAKESREGKKWEKFIENVIIEKTIKIELYISFSWSENGGVCYGNRQQLVCYFRAEEKIKLKRITDELDEKILECNIECVSTIFDAIISRTKLQLIEAHIHLTFASSVKRHASTLLWPTISQPQTVVSYMLSSTPNHYFVNSSDWNWRLSERQI